jgi:hypothetical protein
MQVEKENLVTNNFFDTYIGIWAKETTKTSFITIKRFSDKNFEQI